MNKMDDTATIGLLGAALGAVIELLSQCRTAISDEWDIECPETEALLGKIDAFLGPIADKGVG